MDAVVDCNDTELTGRSFQYMPLDATRREIRILALRPRQDLESGFELAISNVSLHRKGYYALSYTWGDSTDRKEVRLSDQNFLVNANLFEALRAITSRFKAPLMIWADAICINQNDLVERSEQVKLMRDIFANAEGVIAWIGQREESYEDGYKLLAEIAHQIDLDPNYSDDSPKFPDSLMTWLTHALENEALETSWNAVSSILERPWWSRAWIVQEVAVSTNVFLMCGNLLLDFIKVFRACALIYCHAVQVMTGYGAVNKDQFRAARAMMKYPSLSAGTRKARTLAIESAHQWYQTSGKDFESKSRCPVMTFSDILWRFSDRQSGDPRDKIYAYMGLATSKEISQIQVDYDVGVPALYRQIVCTHLEVNRDLKIFDWIAGIEGSNGFSSWARVPMPMSTPVAELLEIKELQIKWNTSLDLPARFEFLGGDSQDLALQGLQFDTILSVGEEFYEPELVGQDTPGDSGQTVKSVYKAWQELAGVRKSMDSITDVSKHSRYFNEQQYAAMWRAASHGSGTYPNGQWALDAFIQTMVMDPHKSADYSMVYFLRRGFLMANARPGPFETVFSGGNLCRRRFFVTARGYFGLGPKTIEVGDKICVLFGASTPYVLRKRDDHYIVVGWSYVHGIMMGEVVYQMNNGELQKETFSLQ